jgi:DNA-binding MarR family transcriptional regulator
MNERFIKWRDQRVTLGTAVPSPIPSGAPVHARAAYLLARVGRTQSVRFSERMRSLGLRPKHFAVLNAIALSDGASQQEIGGRMGLDPSGLVGAIDELERMGLVARRRDPADRRRNVLALTEDGTAMLRRARRLVSDGARELLGPLDDDEVQALVALLGKVAAAGDLERF